MLSENLEALQRRIDAACVRAGRPSADVTLVGVAKTFSADAVRDAVRAGVRDIAENYVQELLEKRERLAGEEIRWHFVGHLQSNKVKYIAPWVYLIHAVDSAALAREIDRRAAQSGRVLDILVEVNTTGEQSKFGVAPGEALPLVRSVAHLRHVRIAGLMTVGPFLPDPEGSRPMFRRLRALRDELASLGQDNVVPRHLSMGMTGDFEVAIDEGATLLRIGTALFGSRTRRTE